MRTVNPIIAAEWNYERNGDLTPDDFTEDLYHKVAETLFAQYKDTGSVNPAQIISMFEEEEEQKEVAALFNARIHEVETQQEMEKALKETIIRVKQNSVDVREANADPTDIAAMMKFIDERKALQQLQNLHISYRTPPFQQEK